MHSSSFFVQNHFSRLSYFEPLLENYSFDVVVSSTWRFHYKISELKSKLKKLGDRVIGVTGESFSGTYPRFCEIEEYAVFNRIEDWRAIDDAIFQFPENESRLIYCDPKEGITEKQIKLLKNWLEG